MDLVHSQVSLKQAGVPGPAVAIPDPIPHVPLGNRGTQKVKCPDPILHNLRGTPSRRKAATCWHGLAQPYLQTEQLGKVKFTATAKRSAGLGKSGLEVQKGRMWKS